MVETGSSGENRRARILGGKQAGMFALLQVDENQRSTNGLRHSLRIRGNSVVAEHLVFPHRTLAHRPVFPGGHLHGLISVLWYLEYRRLKSLLDLSLKNFLNLLKRYSSRVENKQVGQSKF